MRVEGINTSTEAWAARNTAIAAAASRTAAKSAGVSASASSTSVSATVDFVPATLNFTPIRSGSFYHLNEVDVQKLPSMVAQILQNMSEAPTGMQVDYRA